jgi:hypothetical protein
MDMIRTTISLPVDFHEELRLLAIKEKKSLGRLIEEKLKGIKKGTIKKSFDEKIKDDFALFDLIAKTSHKFDAVSAVREEREKDK